MSSKKSWTRRRSDMGYSYFIDTEPGRPGDPISLAGPRIKFWAWHKRYCFPGVSRDCPTLGHMEGVADDYEINDDMGHWDRLEEALYAMGAAAVKSVYMYDHSGQRYSTSQFGCRWYSGQIGFLWSMDKAVRHTELDELVEQYDEWCNDDSVEAVVLDDYDNVVDSSFFDDVTAANTWAEARVAALTGESANQED
jgi:hypothetical protein